MTAVTLEGCTSQESQKTYVYLRVYLKRQTANWPEVKNMRQKGKQSAGEQLCGT